MALFSERRVGYEAVPLASEEDHFSSTRSTRNLRPVQKLPTLFNLCFVLSIALNVIFIAYIILKERAWKASNIPITPYANLPRDVPIPFNSSSLYGLGTPSEKTRSLLWENLDTSAGEISLPNTFAESHSLPTSAPFFWDPLNRSIYLLNGHHSLHCLRKVRRWVTLSQYNQPQLDSYAHLVHCMDHLLQNILCEADDTPMYTSPYANASTGLGQERMCRSWEALAEWARGHTSCFAYVNETQGVGAVIERFRYCPDAESEIAGRMRGYFGYGDEWWERGPEDVETVERYWEAFGEEEEE